MLPCHAVSRPQGTGSVGDSVGECASGTRREMIEGFLMGLCGRMGV
jgi:hypothetical protein